MKMAKFFIATAIVCFGMIHYTTAQSRLSDEQNAQFVEHISSFLQQLNLSENDKVACQEILGDFFIGMVVHRATNFSENTNQKIIKALIKGRDSRVNEVLNSDQYKVYQYLI